MRRREGEKEKEREGETAGLNMSGEAKGKNDCGELGKHVR